MHSRKRREIAGSGKVETRGSRGIGLEYSGCLLYYGLPLGYDMMVLKSSV